MGDAKIRERVKRSDIFCFQNLLTAYHQCRNRKRKTINAAKFELNYEKGLLEIERELKNGTYKPGKSICFVVTSPTPREVFAADFKDRIVHHLLVNYLEPIWEKKFIYHSYACRKNKGAHQALKDIRRSKEYYYLQADISAFFMSLKKDILYNIIKRHTNLFSTSPKDKACPSAISLRNFLPMFI